jgi:hypothetical protein
MTTPSGVLNNGGKTPRTRKIHNFRSRRWGPRSRVCARETLRSAPHRHEWKFSGARVCRVTFVKSSHFLVKMVILRGRGVPNFLFFCWNPPIFVTLKPYDNPFCGFE